MRADIERIPHAERIYWRYLSSYAAKDDKEIELWERIILAYQVNTLSTGPKLQKAVKVGRTLYRINTLYYGELFAKVYENFAKTNPYFPCFERAQLVPLVEAKERTIIQEKPTAVEYAEIYIDTARGGIAQVKREMVKPGQAVYVRERLGGPLVRLSSLPPLAIKQEPQATVRKEIEYDPKDIKVAAYLPAKELQESADLLQTKVPLIRSDWFFYRTAISVNRKGDGYYDFLGIKHRDDVFKLIALDLKVVERLRLDMAAMVGHSGVATNQKRQVWWIKSYLGSYWGTFDVNQDAVGKRNLIRLLGESFNKVDFDHDAEEAFFHLPNKLWGFLACNKDGTVQKFVPTEVAGDDSGTSRDFRIHVGSVSCARCHKEGLRPVDDWGRQTYRQQVKANPQFKLASADPKRAVRLEELYLSEMPQRLKDDNAAYALTLKGLNGLTPEANAEGIRDVWKRYADDFVDMDGWARELGVKPETWKKALTTYAQRLEKEGKLLDPVFAGLMDGQKTSRTDVEEMFSTGQLILREGNP